MLRNIPLGVYVSGTSVLHRLQSRTKLLLLPWFVVWLVIAGNRFWHFAPYIALVLLVGTGIMLAGISWSEIWRKMWLLILLVLSGSLFILSSKEVNSRTLTSIGPLPVAYEVLSSVLLVVAAISAVLCCSSLLPPLRVVWQRRVFKRMRMLLVVVLFACLVSLWLISGYQSSALLLIGPYVITYGGLWTMVTFFVVILAFYSFSLLITMTTSPMALVEGLSMLLSPLRRWKLPVDDFALMALLALRFIPTLLEELEQLLKAQTARGADLTRGTVRERLQSLNTLFVPLMQGTLRRASELATALEARGYTVQGQQTRLYETALGRVDYTVIGIIMAVSIGTLFL